MKKLPCAAAVAALLLSSACFRGSEGRLLQRAAELCQYIPSHSLPEHAADYMTADFYAVIDSLFNLPDAEPLDHEWLYYFVASDGGTMADCTVTDVVLEDSRHAEATVVVHQQREDGSRDDDAAVEYHKLSMERVGGKWLMADFDGHKADCRRHLAIHRHEQAVRDAMVDYLVRQVGCHYLQGEYCVPSVVVVATDDTSGCKAGSAPAVGFGSDEFSVWCDAWIYWYTAAGDTLKTVSGGNHAGRMTVHKDSSGRLGVVAFEQTVDGAGNDASARRIFGPCYSVYINVRSNSGVGEAVRRLQLRQYVRQHSLPFRYYQDFGWPAAAIEDE